VNKLKINKSVVFQVVLVSFIYYLSLYSFTQTSIFRSLTTLLEGFLTATSLIGFSRLVLFSSILLVYVILLIMSLLGGEDNIRRIYKLCFLLYLPSALSYSKIDWLSMFNIPIKFESSLPFNYTLILGVSIPTCYLLLIYTAWHKSTHAELTRRGGDVREVSDALSKQVFLSFSIPILCGLASLAAASLFITTEPVLLEFIKDIPYSHLVISACSVLTLLLCTFYYLTQATEWKEENLIRFVLTELSEPEAVALGVLARWNMLTEEEFIEKLKKLLNYDGFSKSDLSSLLLRIAMKSRRWGYESLYSTEWRIVNGEYRLLYFLTEEAYRSKIYKALKERGILRSP